jgi:iron complex outermembrane receptor protein
VFGRTACDPGASGAYGPGVLQKLYEKQGTDSYAAFAHADWEFYPHFTLTGGIRYTYETKHFLGYQAYLAPKARGDVFAFPGSPADLNNSYENVSPAAALSYQITPDILAYFSFSEGWHSGGFFGVNQNTADFISNQYKAETSKAYELGLKGQYFDHRVQFNVAAFRSDFANKQESAVALDTTTNTVVTIFTNVGGVRYQGIEAEGQWIVTKQLHLSGSFGYLDANYTVLNIGYPNAVGSNVPKLQDASKLLRPRNAPQFTAGGEATYAVPAGPGTLELSSRISWVDDLFAGLYNESYSKIRAHTDVALAVSYSYKNYKVTAFGRNLTDHINETPTYIAPLFAASTITPGRSWGLELQAKF